MSNLYYAICYKLNDWQNHRKDFLKTNALAVKFILYDFINNYYPLFYIAFIKKSTLFSRSKSIVNLPKQLKTIKLCHPH